MNNEFAGVYTEQFIRRSFLFPCWQKATSILQESMSADPERGLAHGPSPPPD